MEFVEYSAKTKEDAITKASTDLGVPSYELEIQVISEGSTGFLGFGSKPAVIKVKVKDPVESETEEPVKSTESTETTATVRKETVEETKVEETAQVKEFKKETPKKQDRPRRENNRKDRPRKEQALKDKAVEKTEEYHARPEIKKEPVPERTEEEIATMKETAEEFLKGVFAAMELPVTITTEYDKEEGSLDIDFEGDDMGILIGKRGQTLDSLQYLVSLVVNKGQKDYVRVKLDTENYRKRRKETLENLAKNIAYKVRRTRKSVSLEPMNPYERRIIHSALQGNKYVETYSEGNEPYRHIVVTLKR